jgi:hypothetical protein
VRDVAGRVVALERAVEAVGDGVVARGPVRIDASNTDEASSISFDALGD